MPIKFTLNYSINSKIANYLMNIESAKERVMHIPLTTTALHSLRETAMLCTTHYSTAIEGNKLDANQIESVLKHRGNFPGKKHDEQEVKGYYNALTQIEKWAMQKQSITEKMIKNIHALVVSEGKTKEYRSGQNVIRDGITKAIVYVPPEAKDVKPLMTAMVNWINESTEVPKPILAGIVHYQFVTIHPYYDGNGRTTRLLTTFILHLGGYDLKRIYSLEECYARNLDAYYEAINIGCSHNYYMGRVEADITKWIEYFTKGMAISFENVLKNISAVGGCSQFGQDLLLKKLDPKQRKAIILFKEFEVITSKQVGELFGFKTRSSSALCATWVKVGFLKVVDPSNKARKYALSDEFKEMS